MADSILERWFPNLAGAGYAVTSPLSYMYNCLAWAAQDPAHWWEPGIGPLHYYWPPGVPRVVTVAAYLQAFAALGFVVCREPSIEPGFEKIALYVDPDGDPAHVARQLPSGAWTSKLGEWGDIEHNTLAALEGDMYGRVAQILKRPRPSP